jgi:hypothetical protein
MFHHNQTPPKIYEMTHNISRIRKCVIFDMTANYDFHSLQGILGLKAHADVFLVVRYLPQKHDAYLNIV